MLCLHLLAFAKALVVLELAREHRRVHFAVHLRYALHNLVVDFGVAAVTYSLLAPLKALIELERRIRCYLFFALEFVVDGRHTRRYA